MPIIEHREIRFDAEGLARAILAWAGGSNPLALPDLAPARIGFDPAEQSVLVDYPPESGQASVRLRAETLGAVLLAFCISHRLPIPRRAEKSVAVEAEAAVLGLRSEVAAMPARRGGRPAPMPIGRSWFDGPPGAAALGVARRRGSGA